MKRKAGIFFGFVLVYSPAGLCSVVLVVFHFGVGGGGGHTKLRKVDQRDNIIFI